MASRAQPVRPPGRDRLDRKSTRLNSSHTVIYTLSLHDALPIGSLASSTALSLWNPALSPPHDGVPSPARPASRPRSIRSEEHTSELQSHSDLHSFPTRRSSDRIARFFDGLELVEPGVVSPPRWRPEPSPSGLPAEIDSACGVARKP